MSPQVLNRFQFAIQGEQPVMNLRDAVQRRLAEGADRAMVLGELSDFRANLEADERHDDEEVVGEVMDMLEGWTQPYLDLSR